ncbi:MAG: DUF1559 domain-containing protein [Thermoguttaceae bacterium]|nr:DUF1559 domain-containing protein [Thermoguttaceae bacterium]
MKGADNQHAIWIFLMLFLSLFFEINGDLALTREPFHTIPAGNTSNRNETYFKTFDFMRSKNGIFEIKQDNWMDASLSLGFGDRYFTEYRRQESLQYQTDRILDDCMFNLQMIQLAMKLYADDHEGRLPLAYTVDRDGKPLHSWRTLLLPYFSADKTLKFLYEKIRLDEPWDSEWNRQFHETIPPVYRCDCSQRHYGFDTQRALYDSRYVSEFFPIGGTYYAVVTGKETAFPLPETNAPNNEGLLFSEIYANTILVMERNESVCWMQPDRGISYKEIADGTFLKKMKEIPRHVDRNNEPYICACHLEFTSLLSRNVSQKSLELLSTREYEDDENDPDDRIVVVDQAFLLNFDSIYEQGGVKSWLSEHEDGFDDYLGLQKEKSQKNFQ